MLDFEIIEEGTPIAQLQASLNEADRRQMDLTAPFKRIAKQFWAEEAAIFASEGSHGGRPGWPELSDKYAKFKQKWYPGTKTMELSGKLANSLTDPKAAGAVYEVSKDRLMLGTRRMVGSSQSHAYKRGRTRTEGGRVYYRSGRAGVTQRALYNLGYLHATGAGNLPVREVVSVTPQQMDLWAGFIRDHLAGA